MKTNDRPLAWATDRLVRLDRIAPGLLARALSASHQRRQSIFASLAMREVVIGPDARDYEDEQIADLADVLLRGRGRAILQHAYGSIPEGFTGALERLGGLPLDRPERYLTLHTIFEQPRFRRKAEALRHAGPISASMLTVVDKLDDPLVHQNVLCRLEDARQASDFADAVAFAKSVCSWLSDDVIQSSIGQMGPTTTLPKVVTRWVRRADRIPQNPVPDGDDELIPLVSPRSLIQAGHRYRNCLAGKVEEVLAGRLAFAEFSNDAVVEFRPLTRGWMVWQVHGHRNERVSHAVETAALARCDLFGIARLDERSGGREWQRYRRFTHLQDRPW